MSSWIPGVSDFSAGYTGLLPEQSPLGMTVTPPPPEVSPPDPALVGLEAKRIDASAPQPGMASWISHLQPYQPPQSAQLTPEQIAAFAGQTIPTGESVSRGGQIVKGRPVDQSYLGAIREILGQQQLATGQRAEAEAGAAQESASEMDATLKRIGAAREKAVAEQESIRSEIALREQRLEQARGELAEEKVDPNRWWSSRTVPQRLASGLAIALGGFLQGYSRGAIQNQALGMIDREIERDIALQREEIARKGDKIKGDENSLGWLYKRLGSATEAERALRDGLTQQMGLKLQQIAMTAQSPVIRANAVGVAAQLREQFVQRKHQETVESFDKQVSTFNVTVQKTPMLNLLQQQMQAKAKDPTAIRPLTEDKGALKEVNKTMSETQTFRQGLYHFWDEWQKLGLPAGTTAFLGKEGARVEMLKKVMTEAYIKKQAGQVSEGLLKQFKTLMAEKYSSNEDVKKRIKDLLHHADSEEQSVLSAYGKHYDVTPYLRDIIAARLYQQQRFGMHYPEFRGVK